MFVNVNGARLYVDVDGAGLVPDGLGMREKPTLIMLHGGPGVDHTIFKPIFSSLTDTAQIIYYDHRGNGRSTGNDRATWTLAQWGRDVKGLCDVLGIEKPIVYGASFGGFVAQSYATQFPDHPSKLILVSTAAKVDFPVIFTAFESIGGSEARRVAEEYWKSPSPESRARYFETCLPLYRAHRKAAPDWLKRTIVRNDVAVHFNGPDNEQGRMDFRADLARIRCPILVMAGDKDPIMPLAFSETIAASAKNSRVQLETFANCGHGVLADAPEPALSAIRTFVLSTD